MQGRQGAGEMGIIPGNLQTTKSYFLIPGRREGGRESLLISRSFKRARPPARTLIRRMASECRGQGTRRKENFSHLHPKTCPHTLPGFTNAINSLQVSLRLSPVQERNTSTLDYRRRITFEEKSQEKKKKRARDDRQHQAPGLLN